MKHELNLVCSPCDFLDLWIFYLKQVSSYENKKFLETRLKSYQKSNYGFAFLFSSFLRTVRLHKILIFSMFSKKFNNNISLNEKKKSLLLKLDR